METKVCKRCGKELPVENFKTSRFGTRVSVCTDCANKKRRANAEEKRRKKIEDDGALGCFTPRQLMQELARRGYRGKLTYTQEIDICNF